MMSSIVEFRRVVKSLYSSRVWKRRVDKMGDDQVMAIYFRHIESEAHKRTMEEKDDGVQLTIADLKSEELP